MSQSDSYWQIISERASVEHFDKDDPFREALSSAESSQPEAATGILTYAREHRDAFLRLLKVLNPEQQEIAIEYILLRKTEQQIAIIHGKKSQGMIGQEIKRIVNLLGAALVLGTRPTPETIAAILAQHGFASELPQDRTAIREIQQKLSASRDVRAIALAEYLNSKRQSTSRRRPRVFRDPLVLGSFEVRLGDRSIVHLFTGRAGQTNKHARSQVALDR